VRALLSCVDLQVLSVFDNAFSEFDRNLFPELSESRSRDSRASDAADMVCDLLSGFSASGLGAGFVSPESIPELVSTPKPDILRCNGAGAATRGGRTISTTLEVASSGAEISSFDRLLWCIFASRLRFV
jgi:hypothetical protein